MPTTPKVIMAFQHRARIRGWLVAAAVSVLSAMIGLTPATAYWHSTGIGTTTVTTSRLATPTDIVTPATSGPSVPLSWTASMGSPTPDGYFVTRITGGSRDPACDSSPTGLITGTSCIDSAVAYGEHAYIVTAVYRSWTAPSSVSSNVIVDSPAQMAFTGTVADASAGAPAPTAPIDIVPAAASTFAITSAAVSGEASSTANLGPVTIETRDASGNVAPAPSGGITATLSSDSTGTATFSSSLSGSPTTTVTIPEGSSTASFYYGDTKAGTPTITVGGVGFTNGSQTVTVAPGDPANLVVGEQPTSTMSGVTIAPAVTAVIVDGLGNQTTDTATVAIAIADDTRQHVLGGTLARRAEGGVVVFDDLFIDGAGTDYTLQLTSPGVGATFTDQFDIT
jgi:hypothetical protein